VFLDVSERRYGEIDEDLGAQNREPTAEELALLDELGLASLKVYLRIETFYVFAKILLDKLARLIPHYFGPARGVRIGGHSSLVDGVLPKFAAGKNLTPVPPPLVALISDLGSRVSAYRDRSITHAYSPRTYRGTAYSLDTGEAKIYTYRLYPRDASEMVGRHSETPRTLLPLIESYVHELVDYFERNRDKADPITRAQG
jgi:hypothetical protein